MVRLTAGLVALVLVSSPLSACTFCDGGLRTKQTLRLQYAQAKSVLLGQLKNPRFDKDDNGFTDLHITRVMKDDPARGMQSTVVLRSYIPVVGNTPTDYLIFCDVSSGKLDPTGGIPATPALVEYLNAIAKLDSSDPVVRLGFYFKHLDSTDAIIAADAFFEFARASDSDIIKAAKLIDAAKVRKLIADEKSPPERLGVFAFLLGVSGGTTDAAFLAQILNENPLPERSAIGFGGLLAGYILLAPKEGWALASGVLSDPKRPYSVRLAAINTVRFFQATRENESKAEVLRCCAALLPHGDLADQAIEDLRRWGYWDLTNEVLAQFPKPSHTAPIVRRSIVRYALCAPGDEAKRFVTAVKATDAKLVRDVEEMLEFYKPANLPKK